MFLIFFDRFNDSIISIVINTATGAGAKTSRKEENIAKPMLAKFGGKRPGAILVAINHSPKPMINEPTINPTIEDIINERTQLTFFLLKSLYVSPIV